MVPNLILHHTFGKIFFSVLDVIASCLIIALLKLKNIKNNQFYACLFLFNPLVINVSTRGSADVIVVVLVFACLYLFLTDRVFLGAIVYGFAVHFKIYPIIFAPSLLLFFWAKSESNSLISWNQVKVSLVAGITFLSLSYWTYQRFGYEGIFETYLYHLIRKDNRHNFSLYFYTLYLQSGSDSASITGLIAFVPQLLLILLVSYKYAKSDLAYTWLLLTMIFVTFNKVVTAQYFLWYFAFIPLIVPMLKYSTLHQILLLAAWLLIEVQWNYWAGLLEESGQNYFTAIWISNMVFFFANISIIVQLIVGYQ